MAEHDRPLLFPLFLDEVKSDWIKRGIWGIIPWFGVACAVAGYAAARFWPLHLLQEQQWGTMATVTAGVLTFNGITLAVTWAAIGKVYEIISRPDFSRFLRAGGALDTYFFYIHLVHVVQILAAIAALSCLFLPFLAPTWIARISVAVMIGTTLYAIRWAAGSVTIAQDVSWRFATFDSLSEDEKRMVWLAASRRAGE